MLLYHGTTYNSYPTFVITNYYLIPYHALKTSELLLIVLYKT